MGIVVRLFPSDLGFAYRSSAIKRSVGEPGRHYVVQRPIHVGQINVNEDARDVGAAR